MQFSKTLLTTLVLGLSALGNAKIFEATGYGDTPDAAKKDAVTNAVKFSVGEYVVNREELNNESFNQNIVSHSNAYVKSIAVKSQKKDGGQYIVDVEVDIESQKLIDAVKAQQTATASNVVGKELLSQFSDHLDKKSVNDNLKKDFGNLVHELLVKPYLEARNPPVNIEIIGKLRSGKILDDKNDKFPIVLSIKLKSDDNYIRSIKRIIKELENENGNSIRMDIYSFKNGRDDHGSSNHYKLDTDKLGIFYKVMDAEYNSMFYQYYEGRSLKPGLKILLLNKDGDVIKEFSAGRYGHTYDRVVYNREMNYYQNETYIEKVDEKILNFLSHSLFSEKGYWGSFFKSSRVFYLYDVDLILDHVMYVTKSELEELKDIKVIFK